MDFNTLIGLYEQTSGLVGRIEQLHDDKLAILVTDFKPIAERFEAKKKDSSATIIVFGVYNSGKSTLINALLGYEAAATGDIPETKRVAAYRWSDFEILDTPGLDSVHSEDDFVTLEQLERADVVIFVMNPIGVAEEHLTIQYMLNMLSQKKKVLVVLNPKSEFSEADFTCLKDNFKQHLQQSAAAMGLQQVLLDIPMMQVNAKCGFQGKVANSPKVAAALLAKSQLPALESRLNEFLTEYKYVDTDALSLVLNNYLDSALHKLNALSSDKALHFYNELKREILIILERCISTLKRSVNAKGDEIYYHVKTVLLNSRGAHGCEEVLKSFMQQANSDMQNTIQSEIMSCSQQLAQLTSNYNDIISNELQAQRVSLVATAGSSDSLDLTDLNASVQAMAESTGTGTGTGTGSGTGRMGSSPQASTIAFNPVSVQLALKATETAITAVLPSLGTSIFASIANSVLKAIPVVGPVVLALSTLYTLFTGGSASSANDAVRRQAEEEQRRNERFISQVEECAQEQRSNFITSYLAAIDNNVRPSFDDLIHNVNDALGGLTEQQQNYQSIINEALQLQSRMKMNGACCSSYQPLTTKQGLLSRSSNHTNGGR